jgi:rhamnosyltransferase
LSVIFLIVTYEPNPELFIQHLVRNIDSSSHVIIIDNSYSNSSISFVNSLSGNHTTIVQNFENIGIAEAQNIGLKIFFDMQGEYLIQLDQDSSISISALQSMLDFYSLNALRLNLAGVGPGKANGKERQVREIKSAGLLLHKSIISKVGPMQSDLFIDLVDYEWCWRANKKFGLNFYEIPCELHHQLGEDITVLGFFKMSIPSPIRHYYQFRNALRLIFKLQAPLHWSILRLAIIPFKLIVYPILLPSGMSRLKYMLFGLIHFVLGKSGKLH